MNKYLAAAGLLAFVVGLVHSVLGERLIFRRMRAGSLIPTNGGKVIGESHVRIIWASWHIVTLLGWLLAAGLVWLAGLQVQVQSQGHLISVVSLATLTSSALVFIATKARHPGWVGLLGVAVLAWLGRAA